MLDSDEILLDRSPGYLSETQRAIVLSSNLIGAGAQLPASIDFASILMSDHGLWYLQSICHTLDIAEIGNLPLPSQWIFACLVRTVSACRESVTCQLQGYPVNSQHFYLSAERLTDEINSSHQSLRHRFLLSMSVGGSVSMLGPLLFHGLSLGELSTYYLEKATKRERLNMACLFSNYGASLSLETSTRLLQLMNHDLKRSIPLSNLEALYLFLERALELYDPLQELDDEHAIFECLVRIFQRALLQSRTQDTACSKSNDDDRILKKIVRLLLEAGLFRNSKLPACYWSLRLLTRNDKYYESPLTLAIRVRNVYVIRLLLDYRYDVNELHQNPPVRRHDCMEHRGTPLTYATWLGFIEVVTVLLEAGADVTKMGRQGQTAAEMAKKCLAVPIANESLSCANDTGHEHYEDDRGSRNQIFTMVCANLKSTHGKIFEDFIVEIDESQASLLRFAGIPIAYFDLARNVLITYRSQSSSASLLEEIYYL